MIFFKLVQLADGRRIGFVLAAIAVFCLFAPFQLKAQKTITVADADFNKRIRLGKELLAFEDPSGRVSIEKMVEMKPFSANFKVGGPRSVYWMKLRLQNTSNEAIDLVYSHGRMSSANLYQVKGDSVVFHAKSGEYLKGSEMASGESRYSLTFRLEAGASDDFYLRIQNTRDRGPKLFVGLKGITRHHADLNKKYITNFTLIGALSIFIFYAISLFIVHKNKPYLWLSLMIFGFAAYTFAVNGYLTDWLFPEYPKLSKTFSPPLGQFGKFCMLMLLLTFLNVKEQHPKWYRVFQGLIVMYALRFMYMYYITIVHEDFGMSTFIGSVTALVTNLVYIAFVISVFRKLNTGKKVFAIGLLIYAIGIVMVGYFWIFQTSGRAIGGLISAIIGIVEVLLFIVGLSIEMRQHEVDKNKALVRINQMQTDQTRKIEQEVVERTAEINSQKIELEERNDRIETLFREVHHRVKNNLQLISSLLNMQQEWSSTEDPAKAIEDSRSRVVAMSMIHQFLYRTDDISTIDFRQYAEGLANRLDEIQVEKVAYELTIDFDKDYVFDIDTSISLGLILNELITNSYKHALLDKRELEIGLALKADKDGYFRMAYSDNGSPIAAPFDEVVKKGFGLRLASRLSRQLQGAFEYEYRNRNCFTVTFAGQELRLAMADEELS